MIFYARLMIACVFLFSWRNGNAETTSAHDVITEMDGTGGSKCTFSEFPELSPGAEVKEILVPEKCKRTGICEDLPDYPEDIIEDLIRRNPTTIFNNDEQLFPSPTWSDYTELCKSSVRQFTPRAAKTKDEKWHYIVNSKKKPQQRFLVEVCVPGDSPCGNNNPPIISVQTGYTSCCEQKFSLREMIALDSNNQLLIKEWFQIPSYCSCLLTTSDSCQLPAK